MKAEITKIALSLGFEQIGFSKAQFLEDEAPRLESWLKRNLHGEMRYMENHFDKRLDPTLLVPGSKTVISLLYNYFPSQRQEDSTAPIISDYALNEDYHHVIKGKLKEMLLEMKTKIGDFSARVFVDSAPVLERVWAQKSGLGWIGKNTLLLSKKKGSYFFLAEIICDLAIEADSPVTDHCGKCTKCIDACPTNAITPYEVDGSRCISYLTIELKDEIPQEFKGLMENRVFGCDICQQVCPWNRFSKPHTEPAFMISSELANLSLKDMEDITEEVFNSIFEKSPIKRTGFHGFKRNLQFLKS